MALSPPSHRPSIFHKPSDSRKPSTASKSPDSRRPSLVPKSPDGRKLSTASKSPDSRRPSLVPKSLDGRKLSTASKSPDGRKPSTASKSPDGRRPSLLPKSPDGRKLSIASKSPDGRRPSLLPKSPDGRKLSTASKSPDSRRPSLVPRSPDGRKLSTASKSPDSRRPSMDPKSPDGRRLSTASRSPEGRRLSFVPPPPPMLTEEHRLSIVPASADGRRKSLVADRLSISTDGQGGVTSQHTVSTLNKSDHSTQDVLSKKLSSLGQQTLDQESSKKEEKEKGTAGSRLLNMLRQTLQDTPSEEMIVTQEAPTLVPFGDVVGCLAVHIKTCRQFTRRIISQNYSNLFIRISISHIVKCTKTRSLAPTDIEKNAVIKFDEVKYFSIQVPRRQEDERNNIFLELMQDGDTEKHPLFLGIVEVHLYEIIQKGCFTEVLQVLNKNKFICRLEVEFMFSYGSFGYGFSHQLKPLQKIVEPSMFMNIAPPPERTDPVTNVITPQPVEYPAFLSPDLKVTIGTSDDARRPDQPAVQLEKLQQPPRQRLEKMKKEYRNLNTWIEKAEYLRNIINPKLDYKDYEESDTNVTLKSSDIDEEEPENISTLDFLRTNSKPEITPSELLENEDKKGLTTPTLKLPDQDSSVSVSYKNGQSSPVDTLLPPINIPERRVEGSTPYLHPYSSFSEVIHLDQRKSSLFPPDDNLVKKYPSILKTSSSLHQDTSHKPERFTHFSDGLAMPVQPLRYENSNKKGKSVAFAHKKYTPPVFKPEYIKFRPKYQFQKISKSGLDPILRNINGKMSFRKKKDQCIYKYSTIGSADVVEHEDQDPPYPKCVKPTGSVNVTWANKPGLITVQMLDRENRLFPNAAGNTLKASESSYGQDPTVMSRILDANTNNMSCDYTTRTKTSESKNKLLCDPSITGIKITGTKKQLKLVPNITMKTSDMQNKLQERLPTVSLPNFKGESSMTGNINTYRPSKSLDFTSDIENLKQSMVLKSILSKNLQDLSDQLFSRPEVYMDMETIRKNSSSLSGIHNKTSCGMEDRAFEISQNLNRWLSSKDILNSQALLSQVIKNIVTELLPEGGEGKPPEEESVSKKQLGVDEGKFPMNKKSSFKKKHLITGLSSKPGLNVSVQDYDNFIKQIFTAPIFSQLGIGVQELSEAQMSLKGQLSTPWDRNVSFNSLNYGESNDEIHLSQPTSVVSQIIQSFPIDSLLESGIIKVVELDKERQSSLLDTEITSPEKEPKNSIGDYSDVKSKTQDLSGQNIPVTSQEKTLVGRVGFTEGSQNMSLQDSKYSIRDRKTHLPSEGQKLDREESSLSSTSENVSNSLDESNESDSTVLNSFLKNIFNIFFKYNQSKRKQQPEKELERLIQHSFPSGAKHFEEIQGSFSKADKLDKKPILSPKLRMFLEELSDSEVKNLKSELSKHIQHYLLERLSESGHITKEDLPKIYQNLYLMHEKTEQKEQNVFQEKYSETVKEIMSFVNNFNDHFIDKHLEIKLRSFLNEILQNYFLKHLSESTLFSETELMAIRSNISSLRTKSASASFSGLKQDISRGSFGKRLEINMKYPLSQSLQNYLRTLSGSELLNLKADLSKYLQNLFMEKLSKSGLMTERQLKGINKNINVFNSNSTPMHLDFVKPDLSFREENYLVREQNKVSKVDQDSTLQKAPEDNYRETEPIRKEETGNPFLENLEENPSTCEQKDYSKEGTTLSLIKAQSSSNKNFQVIPLNKSSERLTDVLLKKHKKEHGLIQVPQAESSVYTTEIEDPYTYDDQSKLVQPKACFERTLKVRPLGRGENSNVYKVFVQETPEAGLLTFPKISNCKISREDEECCTLTFPTWNTNTLIHVNSDSEEQSKLDRYCQRMRGNNNNNKKHMVTFAQFKNEMETLYINPYESFSGKYNQIHESQSLQYKEDKKNSRSFFFPDVLKRETMKPKTRKEKDHVSKPKKPFHKLARVLPAALPTTRTHLRKSIPRTLLHWTDRRTIHDCFEKFEDLHVPSIKRPKKPKSRARLLGKSPDNVHNQAKHCTRPYTAPEPNKQRESTTGKFSSPRMVSAGLVHINDIVSDNVYNTARPS